MRLPFFYFKGTAVSPKCVDCGINLIIYGYWDGKDGPLCYICYKKRIRARGR